MMHLIAGLLLLLPVYAAASVSDYERIETSVFGETDRERAVPLLRTMITGGSSQLDRFRDALTYYRIAEITTNRDLNQKCIDILQGLCAEVTNVYVFCYLGAAYASRGRFLGPIGGVSMAGKAKEYFDFAVTIDPAHYLPRFYRGMFNLFMPGLLGGNEQQGVRDMQIVLNQMDSIHRENDYKAFIYFINGIYWGEKKKDYAKALDFLNLCKAIVADERLLEATDDKIEEYNSRLH